MADFPSVELEAWERGDFAYNTERAVNLARRLGLDVPLFVGKVHEVCLRRGEGKPTGFREAVVQDRRSWRGDLTLSDSCDGMASVTPAPRRRLIGLSALSPERHHRTLVPRPAPTVVLDFYSTSETSARDYIGA